MKNKEWLIQLTFRLHDLQTRLHDLQIELANCPECVAAKWTSCTRCAPMTCLTEALKMMIEALKMMIESHQNRHIIDEVVDV